VVHYRRGIRSRIVLGDVPYRVQMVGERPLHQIGRAAVDGLFAQDLIHRRAPQVLRGRILRGLCKFLSRMLTRYA